MNQTAYQAKMNSEPYRGLQMVHMTHAEAYEFAGHYGMNAIITTVKPPYEMKLVRLFQDGKNKLCYEDHFGHSTVTKNWDIYWVGKADKLI